MARFKTLPLGFGRTEVAVGNWYLRNEQLREAEKWFGHALHKNPYNANAYSLLGRVYSREKQYESACEVLEKAVMLRPDKQRFREHYVEALLELKRCEEALPHLLWLTEKIPDHANYWHKQGDILLTLGCTEVLEKVYEPILRSVLTQLLMYPDDEYTNIDAGIILGRLGRPEEALDKFQKALAVNASSAAALFNTAGTLVQLGRPEEARPLFQKFVQIYPDHPLSARAREQLSR